MPWKKNSDAARHTRRAKSARSKRQWRKVANSVLERTGDEGRAVRAANSVVKRDGYGQKRKPKARRHNRSPRREATRR
jgi:hypothetical protein